MSGLSFLGGVDALGAVTVAPRVAHEYNVVDFGADPTLASLSDEAFARVAALAIAGDVIRVPAGKYRLSQTWGPFAPGVAILGSNGAGVDASAAWLQFEQVEGHGIQLVHEPDGNGRIGYVIRDLTIYTTTANHQTAGGAISAAVAMTGGGAITISGLHIAGKWKCGVKVDGSNQVTIDDCYLKNRDLDIDETYGIWCTEGSSGGEGWTYQTSSNVVSARNVSCNGPTYGIWDEGGATHRWERVLCNLGATGALARIGAVTSVEFDNCYTEGVGACHYLFDNPLTGPTSCFEVKIHQHFASGLSPAIKLTNVTAYNTEIRGGTWNTTTIAGSAQFAGVHVSVGNAYNGSGRFYDTETSADVVLCADLETALATRSRMGASVRPSAQLNERVTTFELPRRRVYHGNYLLEEEWLRSDTKREHRRTLASPNTGLVDAGVAEAIEWGNTGSGAVTLCALAIPEITGALVRARVSASKAGDVTKGGAWDISARIYRNAAGNVTKVVGSDATHFANADASYTNPPTIEVDIATQVVRVRCPSDTNSNWTARLECVVSQP